MINRKLGAMLALFAAALAATPAAAQEAGRMGSDGCNYIAIDGQWVRKGCFWSDGKYSYFHNEHEGTDYILARTARGNQWITVAEYERIVRARTAPRDPTRRVGQPFGQPLDQPLGQPLGQQTSQTEPEAPRSFGEQSRPSDAGSAACQRFPNLC